MGTETVVRLAAKLYETRDTCRRLYGAQWPAEMARWRDAIERAQAAWGCDEVKAALRLVEKLREGCPGSAGAQMMLVGTMVEMIEEATP